MKKLLTSLSLILASFAVQAQTTATDWTATDCNSVSHTLFNELNSGKVVVFSWVMPCASCIGPSKTAYDAVQSFATSHPGRVVFYLADDFGDANCMTLTNWVTNNNIGNTANMSIFSNSGNVIKESDFGGTGMPHIVVMGGSNHQIYFNKFNSSANDATGIRNAITAALGTTGVSTGAQNLSFAVAPNPASSQLSLTYASPVKHVVITSVDGRSVFEQDFPNAKMNPVLDISKLPGGSYVITITDADNRTGTQKLVKE